MAGKRLTEAEKKEVVRCYRETAATAAQLAQTFGVSTSTIVRFLQEGIPAAEYQALVRQKQSQSKQRRSAAPESVATATKPMPKPDTTEVTSHPDEELVATEESPAEFSVAGAADLVGDEFDDADDEAEEEDEDDEAADSTEFAYADADWEVLPLQDLTLPSVCYITVDKFAEIVTRPLREFQEPGRAVPTDGDCPTMPLFAHHRHAKRFVQPNHRLIKMPAHLLTLTQDKLREKGITRLWFEGKVYEL
ncbi:MAG: hypothetical protein ACUVSQ_06805 [Pseudanabaenaceae cyanobacterium]